MRRAAVLCALALWLLHAIPAAQARRPASAPELAVTLAWEGAVRVPGWTEVQITLTAADTPWHGDLLLEDRSQQLTYRHTLDLPASGRAHLRLPLYITEYGTFSLMLVAPGESPVATLRLPLRATARQARFCVALDSLGRLAPGQENGCDASLLLTEIASLPETPMAWDTIDVLILHEVATTTLTPAQQEALWAWVNLGGQLVIAEGPGLAQTQAGLPQPLLQIAVGLTTGTSRAVGAGYLARVSRGTGDAPTSTAWLGDWRARRVPAVSLLATAVSLDAAAPTSDALMQVPLSQVPRLGLWLGVLPLYAVLIGPGAWLLAQRLRRPWLVWVLTPTGILLASLAVWVGLTSIVAGAFPVTHEIAIIIGGEATAPARVLQATAIFAPRARALTWSTSLPPRPFAGYVDTNAGMASTYYGGSLPFPASVVWESQGSHVSAERPPGPITWAAEGLMTLPPITLETTMTTQQGRAMLSGVLRSAIPLREVTLIFENGTHRVAIADVATADTPMAIAVPLQTVQLFDAMSTSFCSILSGSYFYPRAAISLPPGQATAKTTAPCYLTAIAPGVPFPTQSSGATRVEESCLILALPCPTLENGGVPLFPQLDFANVGYGWLDDTGELNLGGGVPVILVYTPLQRVGDAATPRRLTLRFEEMPVMPLTVSLELWDWAAERWLPQPLPESEAPLILEGELARAVYNSQEGLRVRFTPGGSDYFSVNLGAILETDK